MALGVVPGPRFPDAADELAPNLRNQTARYRVMSFDVTLTGLTMRWEQALVYIVGALMFIGVAASVFQLYGAAIVVGCILMVLSLGDGPHGLKVLYRDVKRHVVGR